MFLLPAIALIALTWAGTIGAINAQRQQAQDQVTAQVSNQAAAFAALINRQVLDLDQTLRILVGLWEADPAHFNLQAWHDRASTLSDLSRDMMLIDNHGRVVQSTVPEAGGTDVSTRDYFVYAIQHGETDRQAFIGPATVGDVLRQWHMDVARWMRNRDGSFAGEIVADWRISAITNQFANASLGANPLVELVGLNDGKLRAISGPPTGTPDESIADTPMFAALTDSADGTWIGPSAPDGMPRVHAFRRIPGRDLAIVVGVDLDDALSLSYTWEAQARFFAGCITALIAALALFMLRSAAIARRRQHALAYDRGVIAAANAQLEFAKARADAKTAQLEATLNGMSDGVAMVDSRFCLVEWNKHFPEITGVPESVLRVGLPMEDILRAQAQAGQFGQVDVSAEVTRRMALLRSGGHFGVIERTRPDGRTLELRRNRLPDGGFVTLYTDITARKQSENALREARAIAEAATEARSRFVAIVSHEIRTPLNALLTTLTLLVEGGLSPAQRALLDMARQSGDALLGLINDILEMSRMEAGQLTLRPSAFGLRPLLDSALEIFRPQALDRGITLQLATDPDLPPELYADPGRVRQVLINLLSNAVKFGEAGVVSLHAAGQRDIAGGRWLRLAVRDQGPAIEAEGRARLFRPFSRLDQASGDEPLGWGLGLAICRQLALLMGGEIGCDTWTEPAAGPGEIAHSGNEFWVRLPLVLPPAGARPSQPQTSAPLRRILPRTRILLVEDIVANQLVTATLLRREGHMVDIAGNGATALAALQSTPYDLVFMDIFMPDMSGFEVARRIRALPAPAGTLPIVALTANDSPDDEALCREARMNRLLGKPAVLGDLLQALADLVWRGAPDRGAGAREATPPPPSPPVLSIQRIDALRKNLPSEVLGNMVEECLVDLQARLPTLRIALASGNNEDVVAEAHAMVGMAAGYGMAALEARLRALQNAAREGNPMRAAALAEALDTDLSHAATALRQALAIEMV